MQVAVLQIDSRWTVLLDGRRNVWSFDHQFGALRCAYGIARQTRSGGAEAEILLQGDFGELRRVLGPRRRQ